MELVMGLDIGTQGVRGVVTDFEGNGYASANEAFQCLNVSQIEKHKEQHPDDWWDAARTVIRGCVAQLKEQGIGSGDILALSIDATSGTVLAIDQHDIPQSNGIMYNDARSAVEAAQIAEYAEGLERALGYRVNASFALPKIVWLKNALQRKDTRYIHQGDYIAGKLTGVYDVTDYSNALKTCYDLRKKEWPTFLDRIEINQDRLPKVVAPGTPVANVGKGAVEETGLSGKTVVVAGATDGYASAFAAGISVVSDWASIVGTTMVMKGITEKLVTDPQGRIYSHLHPQGWWLVGGASNVGGRCLNDHFDKSVFDEYNTYVPGLTPTGLACYPLFDKGERFPFVHAEAQGVMGSCGGDDKKLYAMLMEGVGYAERLTFEMLEGLGCEVKDEIYTAGGICKSNEWLQIRSDILNKTLKVPEQTDAVMGTALLASLAVKYKTLREASQNMIRIAKVVQPSQKAGQYEEAYQQTKQELKNRGYIQ